MLRSAVKTAQTYKMHFSLLNIFFEHTKNAKMQKCQKGSDVLFLLVSYPPREGVAYFSEPPRRPPCLFLLPVSSLQCLCFGFSLLRGM